MKAVLLRLITVAIVALILVGCNTVRGMGRDIEKAGETIREVAE